MADPRALLESYDTQLRDVAEVASALRWERHGPLIWATFLGGRGFVTYRSLEGYRGRALDELVTATVAHYSGDADVSAFEWKTRGHDGVPELDEILLAHGFVADDPESVMIGRAQDLAVDVPIPDGVTVRRVTDPNDVRRMVDMQDAVFGHPSPGMVDELLMRLASGKDDVELWVAEADSQVVCAGRLDPVEGTDFAGIWGGATHPAWRRRGIYRALTAERARSALRRGKTLINSDSTEYSRPILQRSGFVKVTTTTPYEWRRAGAADDVTT
jgi:ribosomal protein S18 acetylase RimI-like enzyme